MKLNRKSKDITTKAEELVRQILREDLREKTSEKTIKDVAAKLVKSLPDKAA